MRLDNNLFVKLFKAFELRTKNYIHIHSFILIVYALYPQRQQSFSIILHKFINLKTGPMCIVWLISEMFNVLYVSVKSFLRTNKIIKALKLCKHIKVFVSFCCEYFEMFLIYRFACTLFYAFRSVCFFGLIATIFITVYRKFQFR